ncbi:MAG: Uncharacterized protein G01um101416_485 [Microgenomates group bacterium Gr01-1014_16]|nr:MAG: Uncharacterized protein G01um101416_485 [Microgenomates group bacterium Gr01-1014_16]
MRKLFDYLDSHREEKTGKLLNQLFPIVVCLVMLVAFMAISYLFINSFINPWSTEKIQLRLYLFDVAVGFFLYFVTAVDYALIIGRMQNVNSDSRSRFVMNVFTCLGCFVGVSLVLFLWGFAKEITLLIIPLLVFAAGVMVKLAYEGHEYFIHAKSIPQIIRKSVMFILNVLYYPAKFLTFWMPNLSTPSVGRLSLGKLSQWSFFLPFIIGVDDLVGYMGAMTIYNVFSLLFGIFLADVLIDILIFVSPATTKKIVQSPVLSLLAVFAFLYLGYKSLSESIILTSEHFQWASQYIVLGAVGVVLTVFLLDALKLTLSKARGEHIRGKLN